jgi:hypothetical protein
VTRLSTEVAPYVTHGTYIKRCPPGGSTIAEQLLSLRSPGHVCVRNILGRFEIVVEIVVGIAVEIAVEIIVEIVIKKIIKEAVEKAVEMAVRFRSGRFQSGCFR